MKTDITKRFTWGFLLSEQEFRRLVQSCSDAYQKTGQAPKRTLVTARLRDGALVESERIDDVLSLENNGSKHIELVKFQMDPHATMITVRFQDGQKNPGGWTSIDYSVIGESRD